MKPNPILKKLGFADDDRVVIIHVDDVGMCQASVDAFRDLHQAGVVTCGAVMVPCPWFLEAAEFARQNPEADLGVHLTLTSEWETYRWGPLSTRDPASGLLDEQGYLPRTSAEVQEKADPAAVEAEIEAQIEAAQRAGMQPSHADTHMGALATPRFVQAYLQVAMRYHLPPMMLRLDEAGWRRVAEEHPGANISEETINLAVQMVNSLEEMGVPLLDNITGLPLDSDPATRMEQAKQAFANLPAGITHFVIHAAKDTPELRAITPDWRCRVADYETFTRRELVEYLRQIGVHAVGYRQIQDVMMGG